MASIPGPSPNLEVPASECVPPPRCATSLTISSTETRNLSGANYSFGGLLQRPWFISFWKLLWSCRQGLSDPLRSLFSTKTFPRLKLDFLSSSRVISQRCFWLLLPSDPSLLRCLISSFSPASFCLLVFSPFCLPFSCPLCLPYISYFRLSARISPSLLSSCKYL